MHRRPLLITLGCSLLAGLAPAAHADDDGEFIILHARYGTEQHHVDVTGRLRELARRDRSFRLENELFGVDPDPGRIKTLRIFARDRQGRERYFELREYDWVDGAQFIGWSRGDWGEDGESRGWHGGDRQDDGEFVIQYATYGAGGRDVDVTERLRELARRDRRVRLTNELFGVDPWPGQNKTLRIFARDRSGQERVFEYREYGSIDGGQFVGWGRGDWGRGERGPLRPPTGGRLVIENASYGSGRRQRDVTEALRAQLQGLTRAERFETEVTNELVRADPAPGKRKQLTLTYRWGNDRASTVRVDEGGLLRLP